jgi:hypothetical protein
MRVTAEIEVVLTAIEQLCVQIEPTRQQCAVMIRNMDEAHRDYEEVVGAANQESVRLETAIAHTRRLLAGIPIAPPPSESSILGQQAP